MKNVAVAGIQKFNPWKVGGGLLLVSSGLGAGISAWLDPAAFWPAWLAATPLLLLCLAALWLAWRLAGSGRVLAWMVILAFSLRLGCGLVLEWGLPRYGYTEKHQQAGYVFADAYRRDQEAFALAQSGQPLGSAFQQEFVTDQYGGLLSLSAMVYRYLSPDEQRPFLILFLAAGAAAVGVPFFYSAVRRRWGSKTASLAGWIFVLYPESILLGSSQMREPFLLALAAIAFWSVVFWPRRWAWAAGIASLTGMLLFSLRASLFVMAVCAIWLWLAAASRPASAGRPARHWSLAGRWLAWAAAAVGGILLAVTAWKWLSTNFNWDAYQLMTNSGWVKYLLDGIPAGWRETVKVPFVVGYGLAQPVLPAAIMDPAPAIWQVIGILRALGWYLLAPFLLYSGLAAWRSQDPAERRVLLSFWALSMVWILVSSFRAGGSQWDNPRYRTMLLPWMALLAGWAYSWARAQHDPWLGRCLAVEGIFVLFFTEWYFSRYTRLIPRPPFGMMVAMIVGLSLAVVIGGWAWDRRRRALTRPPDPL